MLDAVGSSRDDILDLFDFAWERFRKRMAGLGDEEWRWQPTPDDRVTLRWRLDHIASFLREDRNAPWLGLPADPPAAPRPETTSAEAALSEVADAYARWRARLTAVPEESLARPMGGVAGHYGDATRRSFTLHIVDELIHHTAEAALLRDLYAGTAGSVS